MGGLLGSQIMELFAEDELELDPGDLKSRNFIGPNAGSMVYFQ